MDNSKNNRSNKKMQTAKHLSQEGNHKERNLNSELGKDKPLVPKKHK
jgi:hypothetical protein